MLQAKIFPQTILRHGTRGFPAAAAVTIFCWLLLLLGGRAWAQSPDYTFRFVGPGSGDVSSVLSISCLLDNGEGEVQGWGIACCETGDVEILGVTNVVNGATAAALGGGGGPAFNGFVLLDEGWVTGVVIDFDGVEVIPEGVGYELHIMSVELMQPGESGLEYCAGVQVFPTAPPSNTTVVVGAVSIVPTIQPHPITVNSNGPEFRRGDVDGNGGFNGLIDTIFLLNFGFGGGTVPPCLDAADVDDDGILNPLVDALRILGIQFSGAPPAPAPGLTCGVDPTLDGIQCLQYTACP